MYSHTAGNMAITVQAITTIPNTGIKNKTITLQNYLISLSSQNTFPSLILMKDAEIRNDQTSPLPVPLQDLSSTVPIPP